jgi:hypothetical protein
MMSNLLTTDCATKRIKSRESFFSDYTLAEPYQQKTRLKTLLEGVGFALFDRKGI